MKKVLVLLTGVLLFSSCNKDEDTTAPLIEITSPAENTSYSALSIIHVTGTVYDDARLDWVQVQLIGNDYSPVLPLIQVQPGSNTYTLDLAYELNDIHLSTGSYYLLVEASDGYNTSSKYISIHISEIPKKLKFLLAVTRSGSDLHVVKIDSALHTSGLITLNSDYLGSGCSSDNGNFYLCGSLYGDLLAYDINNWQVRWNVPVTMDPPFPWFTGLLTENGYCYAGYREGKFEKFDPDGLKLLSTGTATGWPPLKFCRAGDKLITEEKNPAGPARMIEIYYEPTGAILNDLYINESTTALLPAGTNEVYHLTNDQSGQGHLYVLNLLQPGEWEPSSSLPSGKIRYAGIAGNDLLIAHESGIYRFLPSTGSLVQVISGISATCFCSDETQSVLYIAADKTLSMFYDPWPASPYGVLLNSVSLGDTIVAVHAVYNKD